MRKWRVEIQALAPVLRHIKSIHHSRLPSKTDEGGEETGAPKENPRRRTCTHALVAGACSVSRRANHDITRRPQHPNMLFGRVTKLRHVTSDLLTRMLLGQIFVTLLSLPLSLIQLTPSVSIHMFAPGAGPSCSFLLLAQ